MRVEATIRSLIERRGPITFAEYQELALYDPEGGFFTTGGGAGRAGRDFVTSPETGSLFGVLVARQLDASWHELGDPDPFLVVEAGAGRGKLAADVLRAEPECARALRYVLVERSPALRALQRELLELEPADEALGPFALSSDPDDPIEPLERSGPIVTAIDELPGITMTGVVLANELLDNLPVRIVERHGGEWLEVLVALGDGASLTETTVPAPGALADEADLVAAGMDVPDGARLPVPERAVEWLDDVAELLDRGTAVVFDYAATASDLVSRGQDGWMRTYRAHERGGGPLEEPGSQDITVDLPREFLSHAARRAGFVVADERSQADLMSELGIDELVEEGRAIWRERAHLGDLEAIAGRSRVAEAAALTDPSGLGSHRVVRLRREVG
jgi:SAM-dependent MidA family methyltransferase